jgi:hypothetical protein
MDVKIPNSEYISTSCAGLLLEIIGLDAMVCFSTACFNFTPLSTIVGSPEISKALCISDLRLEMYASIFQAIYVPPSEASWGVDTSCQFDGIILQNCGGPLGK